MTEAISIGQSGLALLQLVRLKGRLSAELASAVVGVDAVGLLDQLAHIELIETGARGSRLTAAGRELLGRLLGAERQQLDTAVVGALYEEFDQHNSELKRIVSAWQLRADGNPNDHTDPAYDSEVVARLARADALAAPLVARIAAAVPRLESYPYRLATALERVSHGEHRWLANPMEDSYHQVWFELHEDLLGVLGLAREDEAKAGRA